MPQEAPRGCNLSRPAPVEIHVWLEDAHRASPAQGGEGAKTARPSIVTVYRTIVVRKPAFLCRRYSVTIDGPLLGTVRMGT